MESFRIKFWGVRGSIPTPGPSTLSFGGNTSCVELQFKDGPLFILDAGTGIRELGKHLLTDPRAVDAYIFISHFHWDHIQGLPFFKPAFVPRNRFTILGTDDAAVKLEQIISFQMDPTYFPITIDDMRADIQFQSIKEGNFHLQGVDIQAIYLNHPGYALGFRFTFRHKSLVYISDNEPFTEAEERKNFKSPSLKNRMADELFDNFVENKDEKLVQFCADADILIHDSQFFPEEYQERKTWGHSPFTYTVGLAVKSRVKRLILYHHDPDHDDKTIQNITRLSKKMLRLAHHRIPCYAAKEGDCIKV